MCWADRNANLKLVGVFYRVGLQLEQGLGLKVYLILYQVLSKRLLGPQGRDTIDMKRRVLKIRIFLYR